MPILVAPESSAHWYRLDGSPAHDSTLRQARKELLLPSVTSVLGAIAKPGLEAWKMEQVALAALTLPRYENEALDAFARRVVEDSKSATKGAADFGTEIHAECENVLLGKPVKNGKLMPFMSHFLKWVEDNVAEVISVERSIVNPQEGYAGRVDAVIKTHTKDIAVIDIKTQKFKKKAEPYSTHGMQLAAYKNALLLSGTPCTMIANVYINSIEPMPVVTHRWDSYSNLLEAFRCALYLWQFERDYWPAVEIAKLNSKPKMPADMELTGVLD